MKVLESTEQVIEVLGGTEQLQKLTKAKFPQMVSNWKARGSFPSRLYLVMTGELKRLGYAAPAGLWGIEEPVKETREAKAALQW